MAERKSRVMIVDDAALVRLFCRRTLEESDYEVDEALNGLEAFEKLLVSPADLLLVDVNMPKMDGISFIARLRQQESSLASIPAVVVSTEAGKNDRDSARAAGANYYVVKPVTRDVLLRLCALLSGRTR